jgi:hypothetical protein
VGPGARQAARPGSMTVMRKNNAMKKDVMKNESAADRAVALVHEVLDVLVRIENAPRSPVFDFLTAEKRREMRRNARRLRQQKAGPRYPNLYTAEELADIYERTAQRDEILETCFREFNRISPELGDLLEPKDPEVRDRIESYFREMKQAALEHGPDSEAAQRFRQIKFLEQAGEARRDDQRRQREQAPACILAGPDPVAQFWMDATAAECLHELPEGAEVFAFPPESEGEDSGRGRLYFRIGLGPASWIGSFERGDLHGSTIYMMPDRKHLFVSADGAGYIIDFATRTLVERIGTQAAWVIRDEPLSLFVVNHNGLSLEAFGPAGRLWKTVPIGAAGFREMGITDDSIVGEALCPWPPAWVPFSVSIATGEIRFRGSR